MQSINMARAIAAAATFFLCGSVYASPSAVIEFTVVEHALTDTVVDIGEKGDSLGDLLVFNNPLFDAENKIEIGSSSGSCIRTVVGKAWECAFTNALEGGQITVSGTFHDTGSSTFAVTGGTGRFAGQFGEMQLHFRDEKGLAFNFTFKLSE